jgi:hypothetical protein
MGFKYIATNLLDVDTLDSVSTEDAIYVKEHLYNNRPSKPFRFTDKDDEWIKIDFGAAQKITHISIFNHDLTAAVDLRLQGNAADAWGAPTYNKALTWQAYSLYYHFTETFRWWRLFVDDPTNANDPQIGELFIGEHSEFSNGFVQPGWEQELGFSIAEEKTYFGQNWDYYLSDCKKFNIKIQNLNDPANIDDLEAFFRSIGGSAGRFVFIPHDDYPYCFLVKIENTSIPNLQIVRGDKDLNEWTMTLKTLVRGIRLL